MAESYRRPRGPMVPIPSETESFPTYSENPRRCPDQLGAVEERFCEHPRGPMVAIPSDLDEYNQIPLIPIVSEPITLEEDRVSDSGVDNSNHDGIEDFLGLFKNLDTAADIDKKRPDSCRQSTLESSPSSTILEDHPTISAVITSTSRVSRAVTRPIGMVIFILRHSFRSIQHGSLRTWKD